MKPQGWISLHRKLKENWLWEERRIFSRAEAWIDLLLRSSHEEGKYLFHDNKYKIERGDIITSLTDLSKNWQWNKTKVKRFLQMLIDDKMISYESNTKFTKIFILNFDDYQILKNEAGPTPTKKIRNF
jgi:hypothetical protein